MKLLHLAAAAALCLGLANGSALAFGGSSDSTSKDPKFAEAAALVKDGNYAEAIPLLEQVVVADPKNADAFNYLGYSQRKSGDREAALVNYQKALAIDPEHLGANEYLGELYLETGDMAKAKERLQVLDDACFFGCEEYDELKKAIEKHQNAQSG